jgi:3-deoxy-D-manno-octulosonate 8-phosphate phosphatase (KDO 8-P phosphatase)
MNKIKALLFDVDGVLTDGSIILDSLGEEIKIFNVRDAQLIEFMQLNGFIFGAISGRRCKALEYRLNEMKIDFYRLGIKNKMSAFNEFIEKFNIDSSQIGYVGDDVIDIEILRKVNYSFAPSDACKFVLSIVQTITKAKGGEGVIREIIDEIIEKDSFLNTSFKETFKV